MTINNDINNYYVDNSSSNVLEKVASGLAINKASDDASGLQIADQLRSQNSGLSQAIDNANSGLALTNIADGGLREQKNILENIKQEVLKANNDTLGQSDREIIAQNIEKYVEQFNAIADQTNYNGKNLLQESGDTVADDLSIATDGSIINLNTVDTKSIGSDINQYLGQFATDSASRDSVMDAVNKGIEKINSYQSDFGSAANELESNLRNYLDTKTNIANGESQIRDLDYASIVKTFTKADIQSQIGSFIQSQANANNARTLTLLV
jgi:flagellin